MNEQNHEIPDVQPFVPEMVPSKERYRPEIGDPVLDRLREEDGDACIVPNTPDIDSVIERKKQRNSASSESGPSSDAVEYLETAKRNLEEAKTSIARIESLIGVFDEQPLWVRFIHYLDFVELRKQLESAINEERSIEERIRIAEMGISSGEKGE